MGVGRSQLPQGTGGGSCCKAALAGNPGNFCCPELRAFLGESAHILPWGRMELLCEQSGFPCSAWEGGGENLMGMVVFMDLWV